MPQLHTCFLEEIYIRGHWSKGGWVISKGDDTLGLVPNLNFMRIDTK